MRYQNRRYEFPLKQRYKKGKTLFYSGFARLSKAILELGVQKNINPWVLEFGALLQFLDIRNSKKHFSARRH